MKKSVKEVRSQRINIRLTPKMMTDLERLARKEDRTVSQVCARAIADYTERNR